MSESSVAQPHHMLPFRAILTLSYNGTIIGANDSARLLLGLTSQDLDNGTRKIQEHVGALWIPLFSEAPNTPDISSFPLYSNISSKFLEGEFPETLKSVLNERCSSTNNSIVSNSETQSVTVPVSTFEDDQLSPDYVVIDLHGPKPQFEDTPSDLTEYYVENKDVLGLSSSPWPEQQDGYVCRHKEFDDHDFPLAHLLDVADQSLCHNLCTDREEGFMFNGQLVELETVTKHIITSSLWMKALKEPVKSFESVQTQTDFTSCFKPAVRQATKSDEVYDLNKNKKFLAVFEPVDSIHSTLFLDSGGNFVEYSGKLEELLKRDERLDFAEFDGIAEESLLINFLWHAFPHIVQEPRDSSRTSLLVPRFPLYYRILSKPRLPQDTGEDIVVGVLGIRSSGGLMLVDQAGHIRHCNRSFAFTLLGYGAETELEGKHISTVLPHIAQERSICWQDSEQAQVSDANEGLREDLCSVEHSDDHLYMTRSVSCCTESQCDSSLLDDEEEESSMSLPGVASESESLAIIESDSFSEFVRVAEAAQFDVSELYENSDRLGTLSNKKMDYFDISEEVNFQRLMHKQNDSSDVDNMYWSLTPKKNAELSSDYEDCSEKSVSHQSSSTVLSESVSASERSVYENVQSEKCFPISDSRGICSKSTSREHNFVMREGCFAGLGLHSSGEQLGVVYQVEPVEILGERLYGVWIQRDNRSFAPIPNPVIDSVLNTAVCDFDTVEAWHDFSRHTGSHFLNDKFASSINSSELSRSSIDEDANKFRVVRSSHRGVRKNRLCPYSVSTTDELDASTETNCINLPEESMLREARSGSDDTRSAENESGQSLGEEISCTVAMNCLSVKNQALSEEQNLYDVNGSFSDRSLGELILLPASEVKHCRGHHHKVKSPLRSHRKQDEKPIKAHKSKQSKSNPEEYNSSSSCNSFQYVSKDPRSVQDPSSDDPDASFSGHCSGSSCKCSDSEDDYVAAYQLEEESVSAGPCSESSNGFNADNSAHSSGEDESYEGEFTVHDSDYDENSNHSNDFCTDRMKRKEKMATFEQEISDIAVAISGEYTEFYGLLQEIGRGAFGSVRLSFRRADGLLAVTKLIPKSCVGRGNWVTVNDGGKMPLEVAILSSLQHPNIVSVLDVFDNKEYVQLVMEKFGAGLDLFEFIERDPVLDDPLAAYIFAQLISALLYLRAVGILHRDVKDENIIINEKFHIKLIDFGSATYARTDGKLFSQFAGTVEYCSPEVLLGNKYLGPELEMWSVGVTLYTLMVGENPFHSIDQTIHKPPMIPEHLSLGSTDLIMNLLQKDPQKRYTLDQVAAHEWTRQPCNPDFYNFADILTCSEEECEPRHYATLSEQRQADNKEELGLLSEQRRADNKEELGLLVSSSDQADFLEDPLSELELESCEVSAESQSTTEAPVDLFAVGLPAVERIEFNKSPSTLTSSSDSSSSSLDGSDTSSSSSVILYDSTKQRPPHFDPSASDREMSLSFGQTSNFNWSNNSSADLDITTGSSQNTGANSSFHKERNILCKFANNGKKQTRRRKRRSARQSLFGWDNTGDPLETGTILRAPPGAFSGSTAPNPKCAKSVEVALCDEAQENNPYYTSSDESKFISVNTAVNVTKSCKNKSSESSSESSTRAHNTGYGTEATVPRLFVVRKGRCHIRNRLGKDSKSSSIGSNASAVSNSGKESSNSEHTSSGKLVAQKGILQFKNNSTASDRKTFASVENDSWLDGDEELSSSESVSEATTSNCASFSSEVLAVASNNVDKPNDAVDICNTSSSSSSEELCKTSESTDTLENSPEIITVKRVSTPDLQDLMDDDCLDTGNETSVLRNRGTSPTRMINDLSLCSEGEPKADSEDSCFPATTAEEDNSAPTEESFTEFSSEDVPFDSFHEDYLHQKMYCDTESDKTDDFGSDSSNIRGAINPLYSYPIIPSEREVCEEVACDIPPFNSLNDSRCEFMSTSGPTSALCTSENYGIQYYGDLSQHARSASQLSKLKSYSSECITENYDENILISVEHHPDIKLKNNGLHPHNSVLMAYSSFNSPQVGSNESILDCVENLSDVRSLDESIAETRNHDEVMAGKNLLNTSQIIRHGIDNPNFELHHAGEMIRPTLFRSSNHSAEQFNFVSSNSPSQSYNFDSHSRRNLRQNVEYDDFLLRPDPPSLFKSNSPAILTASELAMYNSYLPDTVIPNRLGQKSQSDNSFVPQSGVQVGDLQPVMYYVPRERPPTWQKQPKLTGKAIYEYQVQCPEKLSGLSNQSKCWMASEIDPIHQLSDNENGSTPSFLKPQPLDRLQSSTAIPQFAPVYVLTSSQGRPITRSFDFNQLKSVSHLGEDNFSFRVQSQTATPNLMRPSSATTSLASAEITKQVPDLIAMTNLLQEISRASECSLVPTVAGSRLPTTSRPGTANHMFKSTEQVAAPIFHRTYTGSASLDEQDESIRGKMASNSLPRKMPSTEFAPVDHLFGKENKSIAADISRIKGSPQKMSGIRKHDLAKILNSILLPKGDLLHPDDVKWLYGESSVGKVVPSEQRQDVCNFRGSRMDALSLSNVAAPQSDIYFKFTTDNFRNVKETIPRFMPSKSSQGYRTTKSFPNEVEYLTIQGKLAKLTGKPSFLNSIERRSSSLSLQAFPTQGPNSAAPYQGPLQPLYANKVTNGRLQADKFESSFVSKLKRPPSASLRYQSLAQIEPSCTYTVPSQQEELPRLPFKDISTAVRNRVSLDEGSLERIKNISAEKCSISLPVYEKSNVEKLSEYKFSPSKDQLNREMESNDTLIKEKCSDTTSPAKFFTQGSGDLLLSCTRPILSQYGTDTQVSLAQNFKRASTSAYSIKPMVHRFRGKRTSPSVKASFHYVTCPVSNSASFSSVLEQQRTNTSSISESNDPEFIQQTPEIISTFCAVHGNVDLSKKLNAEMYSKKNLHFVEEIQSTRTTCKSDVSMPVSTTTNCTQIVTEVEVHAEPSPALPDSIPCSPPPSRFAANIGIPVSKYASLKVLTKEQQRQVYNRQLYSQISATKL